MADRWKGTRTGEPETPSLTPTRTHGTLWMYVHKFVNVQRVYSLYEISNFDANLYRKSAKFFLRYTRVVFHTGRE